MGESIEGLENDFPTYLFAASVGFLSIVLACVHLLNIALPEYSIAFSPCLFPHHHLCSDLPSSFFSLEIFSPVSFSSDLILSDFLDA